MKLGMAVHHYDLMECLAKSVCSYIFKVQITVQAQILKNNFLSTPELLNPLPKILYSGA